MNYPQQGGLGMGQTLGGIINQECTVDRPQTDIESAISNCERISNALTGVVEQLEKRLTSVLSTSPPRDKSPEKLTPIRVPLANQISSIADANEKSLNRITEIIERIQLPL